MDESTLRHHAEALCSAIVAGDIDRVTEDFSEELRHNLGEVLSLFTLPSETATIEAVDRAPTSGFTVRVRLVGGGQEVELETRWKERDGRPIIIEISHLSAVATLEDSVEDETAADGEGSAAPD